MRYVLVVNSLEWHLADTQPPQWSAWVRACGGGVFHTSAGLLVDAPPGTPLYGWLASEGDVVAGVTLGSQYSCRFARQARHFHAPTLPALAPGVDPERALSMLRDRLMARGIAETVIGSYDAGYTAVGDAPRRLEYIVQIPSDGDISAQLSSTHRRHLRRGDRDGWSYRLLTGAEATAAVLGVQESTAQRATTLRRGFTPAQGTTWSAAVAPSLTDPNPDYGLVVAGAYQGDALLASILVGWAAERAFYLIGGSTPDGYRRGAAVWLHGRMIRMLAEHGVRTYNLGGTPLEAELESSPAHGLYRFKTGFGVHPVERRGIRWVLRPGHVRVHTLVARLLRRAS